MDASHQTAGLSGLRRELEEILALVRTDPPDCRADRHPESASAPAHIEANPAHHPAVEIKAVDSPLEQEPDQMLADALVVITEFGRATPAILQMWLSIDYARAARILSRFEAEGLVSAKGRVRHKAYELRRTRCMEFRL